MFEIITAAEFVERVVAQAAKDPELDAVVRVLFTDARQRVEEALDKSEKASTTSTESGQAV